MNLSNRSKSNMSDDEESINEEEYSLNFFTYVEIGTAHEQNSVPAVKSQRQNTHNN